MTGEDDFSSLDILQNLAAAAYGTGATDVDMQVHRLSSVVDAHYIISNNDEYGIQLEVPIDWAKDANQGTKKRRLASVRHTISVGEQRASLKLLLREPGLLPTFGSFLDDLIQNLENSEGNAGTIALQNLTDWAELFRFERTDIPAVSKQAGLVWELMVLKQILQEGELTGIEAWRGPEGFRHDFKLELKSIECKAITSRERFDVEISNLEQLEPENEKPLFLTVQKLIEDDSGTVSIPKLVTKILSEKLTSPSLLYRKLLKVGISPELLNYPAKFANFKVLEGEDFQVTETFPRLRVSEMDSRVRGVRFRLNLSEPHLVPGWIPERHFGGGN